MQKRVLLITLLLLGLALAACGGQKSQTAATQAPAGATAVAQAPETTEAASAPTDAAQSSTPEGSSAVTGCTVESQQPTAGPTEQSLFPPVSEEDWTKGPATASITIIEYSDYQ